MKIIYLDMFFIFLVMGIVIPILTLNILTGLPCWISAAVCLWKRNERD